MKSTSRARLEGHEAREGCRVSSESRAWVSIPGAYGLLVFCSVVRLLPKLRFTHHTRQVNWQKLVIWYRTNVMKLEFTFKINLFSFIVVIGSLHITILDSRPATIGELDIFANGPEETVILCPQASGREYHVHLSGTPNIRYTAAVTDKLAEISLNTCLLYTSPSPRDA